MKSTPEQMAAGMATTVTAGDSRAPSKTSITGYSILHLASMDDAIALMSGHPHFHMPGAFIEILECVKIPGM